MSNQPIIATLVTGAEAFADFQTLLFTLRQWHTGAEVFVATDSPTAARIIGILDSKHIRVHLRVTLDAYVGKTRADMEATSGRRFTTLFHDYTAEKIKLMRDVLSTTQTTHGVWFLDADICLMSALPNIPDTATVALSPHYIRAADEARYGRYNAGFLWIRSTEPLDVWNAAMTGSRFFEQAALEVVAAKAEPGTLFEIAIQNNFGWWRLFQSADAPPVIESRLAFFRAADSVGLRYAGETLRSIHTHWTDKRETPGSAGLFNKWILARLEFLARSHKPAKALLTHLKKLRS